MQELKDIRIGVIGLGYVGLPLAVAFSRKYPTVGFDLKPSRVAELSLAKDITGETTASELREAISNGLRFSTDESILDGVSVFIVTVPTPIDEFNVPDLRPLKGASETIGRHIEKGGVVIFESTTFPTCTRAYCAPLIEKSSRLRYLSASASTLNQEGTSLLCEGKELKGSLSECKGQEIKGTSLECKGLVYNQDFYCGYSPERINPADPENKLLNIKKITSGSTPEVADFVDKLYNSILLNGTHRAPSMEVAELAKAIENAQRDTNIAFINEIAILCNAIGINTKDVIDAAGSKWNFHKYQPGLVGGHCISVDPYYIQYIAQSYGITTDVINAARRTNNHMADFVATNLIKMLAQNGKPIVGSKVLVMGCTFKENCPDIRNSKVFDIIGYLKKYNLDVTIFDPYALNTHLPVDLQPLHISKIEAQGKEEKKEYFKQFDSIMICVKHDKFLKEFEESDVLADSDVPLIYDLKHLLDEYKGEINKEVKAKALSL